MALPQDVTKLITITTSGLAASSVVISFSTLAAVGAVFSEATIVRPASVLPVSGVAHA